MIYFIPTPIGNLEDISHRSLSALMRVSNIFCEDTRITKKLLTLLEQRYNITNQQKNYISFHSHNEDEMLQNLDIEKLKNEEFAFVSDAGMPCISDPGAKLIKFCQTNNIDYEVFSGANAALLAFASSGFIDTNFTFFGFLPHKGSERESKLNEILNHPHTAILYESPHRIELLAKELSEHEGREVFFIKEATKKYETKIKCNLENAYNAIKNANQKGEWTVVIEKNPNPINTQSNLSTKDILNLDIKPKQKAKLLAKLTDISSNEWYKKLTLL